MSDASDTVIYVGDLLTFPLGPEPGGPGIIKLRPGLSAGARLGLRRGTSATSWYDTGCRIEASDPAGALAAYERALAGCPSLADAHNNLGRLHHDAGATATAEACYRLAICADPSIALYWFNLGVAVEDQGRRAEAVSAYERAIGLDDGLADAHYNLARLLELTGRRVADHAMLCRAVRHLLRYRQLAKRSARAH